MVSKGYHFPGFRPSFATSIQPTWRLASDPGYEEHRYCHRWLVFPDIEHKNGDVQWNPADMIQKIRTCPVKTGFGSKPCPWFPHHKPGCFPIVLLVHIPHWPTTIHNQLSCYSRLIVFGVAMGCRGLPLRQDLKIRSGGSVASTCAVAQRILTTWPIVDRRNRRTSMSCVSVDEWSFFSCSRRSLVKCTCLRQFSWYHLYAQLKIGLCSVFAGKGSASSLPCLPGYLILF